MREQLMLGHFQTTLPKMLAGSEHPRKGKEATTLRAEVLLVSGETGREQTDRQGGSRQTGRKQTDRQGGSRLLFCLLHICCMLGFLVGEE